MRVDIEDRWNYDLTPEAQEKRGLDPIICGDNVTLRFQALDEYGNAIDLSGVTALRLSVRAFEDDTGAPLFTRDLDVVIANSTPANTKQVVRDTDQTAEAVDANGEPIGKGWFSINFNRADETALLALAGKSLIYDVRMRQASNVPRTLLRGKFRVLRALSTDTQLP